MKTIKPGRPAKSSDEANSDNKSVLLTTHVSYKTWRAVFEYGNSPERYLILPSSRAALVRELLELGLQQKGFLPKE